MTGSSSSYNTYGENRKPEVWIRRLFMLTVALVAFIVYALTTYRNIDWWFGASYTLTAVTFGVHSPPGSLVLTILGWIVAQLPLGISKAFTLNLFSGAIGAAACCLVALLGSKLIRHRDYSAHVRSGVATTVTLIGAAAGSLFFAFSDTMWRYSIIFMPYALTALFTVIILWAIFAWWRREAAGARSDSRLFLVMLLFGLDLSIHRTNMLMLPGFLLWVLICLPSIYRRGRSWAAGTAGLFAGLAFHLLIIPMAARDPALNFGDPSTWRRFYEYVSLQQYGGSWLVNMWPRNASFLYQLKSYFGDFRNNFISYGGFFSYLPLVLFHVGMVALGRRDGKLLYGILIMFLCASLGAVVFFNVPEGYIFPMDRHYIPSFVIFGLFLVIGTGSMMRSVMGRFVRIRLLAVPIALILVLSMPVKQVMRNYDRLDGSESFFGYDFAHNILSTVQPGAIVIVQGDNYWAVRGLQVLEDMRPDVTVLSTSLLNAKWYIEQIMESYDDLPFSFTEEELEGLEPAPWQDTTIVTQVEGDPEIYQLWGNIGGQGGLETDEATGTEAVESTPTATEPAELCEDATLPDSFAIAVPPSRSGGVLLVGDQVLVRMIEKNRWRRPIYFTIPPGCLRDYLRMEGLVWLLVPQYSTVLNADLLRDNLLERYSIRGYSDVSPPVSIYTKGNGMNLQIAFYYLAAYEAERGDTTACRETAEMLNELLPLDLIEPQPSVRDAIERLCQ